MKTIRISIILGIFCFWSTASAQLVVDNSMTPEELVQNILVGSGITVSNVTYIGEIGQRGSFLDGVTTNLGLRDGVILTSGDIFEIPDVHPDACNNTASSNQNMANSDPDLVAISGNNIQDALMMLEALQS